MGAVLIDDLLPLFWSRANPIAVKLLWVLGEKLRRAIETKLTSL